MKKPLLIALSISCFSFICTIPPAFALDCSAITTICPSNPTTYAKIMSAGVCLVIRACYQCGYNPYDQLANDDSLPTITFISTATNYANTLANLNFKCLSLPATPPPGGNGLSSAPPPKGNRFSSAPPPKGNRFSSALPPKGNGVSSAPPPSTYSWQPKTDKLKNKKINWF